MSEQTRSGAASAGRHADIRQLLGALAVTLISVGMLLGSFLLSQLDMSGMRPPPPKADSALPPSPTPFLPTMIPTPSLTSSPSPPPSATEAAVPPTPTPSASPTPPSPLMPSCSRPPGWIVYTVQQGDTLASLAWRTGVTKLALMQANCLSTPTIYSGQQIYVPPTLYASPTPQTGPYGPPLDWVVYIVRAGDNLYSLSRRCGVSMEEIRRANCLTGYTIYVGQALFLPTLPPTPIPTPVPSHTPTPTESPMPTPTPTVTPAESPIFTPTPIPSLAPTPTPTPTGTATHTPTYTPTPTEPPGPTSTPIFTPAPTSTELPTSMHTPTPTSTATPTPTLAPTLTPSGG